MNAVPCWWEEQTAMTLYNEVLAFPAWLRGADLLCRTVRTHHVLDVVRVRVEEGVRLRSHPNPLLVLRPEPVHDREHLALLLQHCGRERE